MSDISEWMYYCPLDLPLKDHLVFIPSKSHVLSEDEIRGMKGQKPMYLPSPEKIREETRKIRERWSSREEKMRQVGNSVVTFEVQRVDGFNQKKGLSE